MADNIWTAAVEGIAARGRANNGAEGDYRDEEGFLCCGKCHTRKEGDITIGEKTLRVPHLCKCESEASRQREAEEKAAEFRKQCERLRKDGITDPSYLSQNFTQDDNDNIWTAAVEGIAARGRANNGAEGDYRDEEGFLCCGKCHTRKEGDITIGEKTLRVPHLCKCESEASRQREAEEKAAEFRKQCERLRKDGITDPSYLSQNFTQDDNRNARISDVCRRYVEHWPEMKADNIGILFYGGVGTGKSFLACCIANALIDKQVRASVTNFPRILNKLQGFGEDKQEFLDKLSRYDLLVIDDLGVERDTSYSVEQVFNVIDARSRTGKPLIVTTNLSLADLQNPSSLGYSRIYDRILEMCPIRLKLAGDSRRTQNAQERRDKAKRLLGLERT